ncbi:MAG: hypothetical protein D6694_11335, partial [Gammaproteobacteria bacterium]
VYVHNIETEQTVYYTVRIIRETEVFQSNRFQSTVLRRTAVSGPFPAEPEAAEYIKLVYRLERNIFNELGIRPPGRGVFFETRTGPRGAGYYIGNFPTTVTTIIGFASIGQYGYASALTVAAGLNGMINTYIAERLTQQLGFDVTSADVGWYINRLIGQLQISNSNSSQFQITGSMGARLPLIGSAQANGSAGRQFGTTMQFTTSFTSPTLNIVFDDGMISLKYDPSTGRWNIDYLMDAEGQIILYKDGKWQLVGEYRVTDKNQALYQMIFRIMRMYNLINRAQFLRMTRVGSVFTCEGWGPCTPEDEDPNDDDENDSEQQ